MSSPVASRSHAEQRDEILRLLRVNRTMTSVELNPIAFRYSARIYDLRQMGYDIRTIRNHPVPRVTTYEYVSGPKVRRVKPPKKIKRVRPKR